MAGNEWATDDNELPYTPNPHTRGTILTPRGIKFWLTHPRPVGIGIDEWEKQEQDKWDRIWGKKGE